MLCFEYFNTYSPGYVEGNIILTEEAHDELYDDDYFNKKGKDDNAMGKDLQQSNGKLDTETQIHTENIDKKGSSKASILTKGLRKHSRYSRSGMNFGPEHSRHLRTSSAGSNVMTQSNQYAANRGYAKLHDQTFKSGDFTKMRTEIEEMEFDSGSLNAKVDARGHRRKPSAIKKVTIFIII